MRRRGWRLGKEGQGGGEAARQGAGVQGGPPGGLAKGYGDDPQGEAQERPREYGLGGSLGPEAPLGPRPVQARAWLATVQMKAVFAKKQGRK